MVLVVEPLAQADLRGVVRKMAGGAFRSAVLVQQAHVEVAVIGGAFGFAVARGGRPGGGKVIQAIPVDARGAADQQLGGALQAPFLNLLGAERGDAYFAYPDGHFRTGLDAGELVRPFVQQPVVPVQREAVHGNRVQLFHHALRLQHAQEVRVYRRHAAEHAGQAWRFGGDCGAGEFGHCGKGRPARVVLEVPVTLVVRLVPDHRGLDHRARSGYTAPNSGYARSTRRAIKISSSGWLVISNPALRSMAAEAARLGAHQFVWSLL